MTNEKLIFVFFTAPDEPTAEKMADRLLEDRVAACVSRISNVVSVYRWKGRIEKNNEILLIAKSRVTRFKELEEAILHLHPDEVPEIVAVQASAVHEAYAKWLADETTAN